MAKTANNAEGEEYAEITVFYSRLLWVTPTNLILLYTCFAEVISAKKSAESYTQL